MDQDTDRWVFEVLAPHLRRKVETLEAQVQWTDLMYASAYPHAPSISTPCSAQSLVELHAMGVTRKEIEGALHILPFVSLRSH